MAGAELCSGERVAAIINFDGKVQHLVVKLFSKTIQYFNVKKEYWIPIGSSVQAELNTALFSRVRPSQV